MKDLHPSVAFVVANYPPHSGGVQQHVQAVAHRLVARGIPTTVYCCEDPGQRFDRGVRVRGMGRHVEVGNVISFPDANWWGSLSYDLQRTAVSTVSVHTRFFPATWLGVSAARRVGIPVVLTEHGGGSVQTDSPAIQAASRVVDRSFGRWAVRQADGVTAVSRRAAEFTAALSGRQALVIPNGIDVDFWKQAKPANRRTQLLFVGRLVAEKGWRTFLDIVRASPADVSAYVVGDGPDLDTVQVAATEGGLAGRVEVTGAVSPEELRALYPDCVYVNPSTAAEGCQTTLLEAAACGARIASYDVGGAAEVARAGAQIEIVPPGHNQSLTGAVHQLLQQEPVTASSMNGFAWDHVVEEYLSVFASTRSRHGST